MSSRTVPDLEGKISRAVGTGREIVHFINPKSGSSRYYDETRKSIDRLGGKVVVSEHSGQIAHLVSAALRKDPYTHAVIYGGDGTVYEAVNGIMESGASETATLSVIPSGSGNDFSTYANDSGVIGKGETKKIDVVKTTSGGVTRYFQNMMNIGFDCSIAAETVKIRNNTIIKGSAAYIAGVIKEFARKKTFSPKITLSGCIDSATGEPIGDIESDSEILLTACANGQYCGGGFRSAPLASLDDGLMDVLIVNDLSRMKFLTIIGEYHEGTFVNERGEVKPQFASIVSYIKCRKMTITGAERICLDGEIIDISPDEPLVAEVIPQAINFRAI